MIYKGQVVTIQTGKYAGLAGVVTDIRQNGDIRVRIEGVRDGAVVDVHSYFKPAAVVAGA